METIIVTGGFLEPEFTRDYLQRHKDDLIIAVDHGLDFLDQNGILPQEVVGDFDSAAEGLLEKYQGNDQVHVHKFEPEKDDTDTGLAVRLAIDMGSTHVVLLGATGTRLDHVLGNIALLGQFLEAGVLAEILDPNNRIRLIDEKIELMKMSQFGHYISLMPYGGIVEGITLTGFKYPLDKYTLTSDSTRCISNEIQEETAQIQFTAGKLLIIESRDTW